MATSKYFGAKYATNVDAYGHPGEKDEIEVTRGDILYLNVIL